MIASLPMYARPYNRAAHDNLWAGIRDNLRAQGIAAPDALDHDIGHMESWAREDLVLGQICNLPYRARFRDQVTVIGAADYGLPDCAAGYYRSVIITRADAPDAAEACLGQRFACNDLLSQSGFGAAQVWAREHGHSLRPSLLTGGHAASLAAVANGAADYATLDAQTWWIEQAINPHAANVMVVGHTHSTPSMTFITRTSNDPAPFFAAIRDAIAALSPLDHNTLGLRGIVALPASAYDIPLPDWSEFNLT